MTRLVLAQDPLITKLSAAGGLEQRLMHIASLVFPGVPDSQLRRGLLIADGTLVQMMANRDIWTAYRAKGEGGREAKADVDVLVRFVASGLVELMALEPRLVFAAARSAKVQRPRG